MLGKHALSSTVLFRRQWTISLLVVGCILSFNIYSFNYKFFNIDIFLWSESVLRRWGLWKELRSWGRS